MGLRASYQNGFAPRDGERRYPSLGVGCVVALNPAMGATGQVLRDLSGKGWHGNLTNMTSDTDWVRTSRGLALQFASTKYVNVPSFNALVSVPIFSLSFWCSADSRGGSTFGAPFRNGTGAGSTVLLYVGANSVRWRVSTANELTFALNHDGVMRHVCLVYKSGVSQTAWVDGVQIATRTPTTSNNSSVATLSVGESTNYWDGTVTDFLAYNRALEGSEIALLARRPGIANELAAHRRTATAVAGGSGNRRRRLLIGA